MEAGSGMNFPFNCPGCGHENHADWTHIGQQVLCGWCNRPTTVPAPMELAGGETEPGLAIRFNCPACGRSFATKLALAGQKIRCSGCGGGVRVPVGNSIVAANPSRVVLSANSGSGQPVPSAPQALVFTALEDDEDDEVDRAMSLREQLASVGGLKRRRAAAVELPSRAETMEQVRQEVAEKEAATAQKKVEKEKRAKKRKRKRSGDLDLQETLTLVGGVSAVVGVLGFVAWYFPDFRYFLGGLVAVIGFFLYFLGARSLRELVAKEGFVKLMLYRFFPPYQMWFVLTHWDETRDFFAFFVSGAIIMSIGGAVITTSPTFRRASENEREYRKAVREAVYGELPTAPKPAARKTEEPAKKSAEAEKKPAEAEKKPAEAETKHAETETKHAGRNE
jgi:hypothetical protein